MSVGYRGARRFAVHTTGAGAAQSDLGESALASTAIYSHHLSSKQTGYTQTDARHFYRPGMRRPAVQLRGMSMNHRAANVGPVGKLQSAP
ncbi:hypothetical protein BamIOP4010DRAFT_4347 [Burkholderia ambifaria IOP40-10]|uniref:Uncharacterized protein n=1 Tax=Burkholderia ambifaria IOP40-10 TaxID=396596 RepID=B1FJY6_9BURK|nr:hypothetical protein BamIOP4010DRAFT_4347 [Burkholderia ambifaria IOP40-10]